MRYECTVCGYVYDDSVEPIKFEDLPDTWVCPLCGVGKDMFKKIYSHYDKEKKCSRAKRTLIGRIDPESGEIVPTDGRNKGSKSKSVTPSPDADKDKLIRRLEDENRQLKLQIVALKKEINRIKSN